MGTNYYLIKKCSCGESTVGEKIHLGKSSGGWAFSFRGFECLHPSTDLPGGLKKVESIEDWEALVNLPGYIVINEYNVEEPDKAAFIKWAKDKKGLHHAIEMRKHPNNCYFKDEMIGGYSFSFNDFS